MIQYIIRPITRFAILIPGIIIAYFSVQTIFPYFDTRLPLGVAIFVTYALGAYILAPAFIRVVRIFIPAKHLPLYCVTPDGLASDPLNIGVIGTRRELILAMHAAGWHVADNKQWRNVLRQVLSGIFEWDYPNAPVSSLYLFGRKQDIAFEIPLDTGRGDRHHVRFWATTYERNKRLTFRTIEWRNRKAHVFGDTLLWVGAASLDQGFGLIKHNLQVTHMIHPNTDDERALIVDGLTKKKLVKKTTAVELVKPYRVMNRVFRGFLQTDGKMCIVELKKQLPK